MVSEGGTAVGGTVRRAVLLALLLPSTGCSFLPAEFNLSPLYRQRLDRDGSVLEWDCLWPIFHYERTAEGFDDFRIRPLYRRIGEPEAIEHEFLTPLGMLRTDHEEAHSRLFPLWRCDSRINEEGQRDVDWYLIFPFLWGGWNEDGSENYLALIPIYADIPNFLAYDRLKLHLFPLHVETMKGGHRHHLALWPFIAWSNCAEANHSWFHVLPFYGQDIEPGHYERYWFLWPIFHWSRENLDSDDPVDTIWLWPIFGVRRSRDVDGWSILWPFFEKTSRTGHFYKLNVLWPFFHYFENRQRDNLVQWWLWPLVGHVESDRQHSWTFLWPLLWFRQFDDPDGSERENWVLPVFWEVHRARKDGTREDFVKIWPLGHDSVTRDADGHPVLGDWSMPSLLLWRNNQAWGMREAYGFLWELLYGRAIDDDSFDVIGNLFTTRTRQGRTQTSMPLLFSYEADQDGSVLRLFQFLPIRFGSGGPR
jgi:hypothetical protein